MRRRTVSRCRQNCPHENINLNIILLDHVTMLIKCKTVKTLKVIYISACKVTEVQSFIHSLDNSFAHWLILVELVPICDLWREKKRKQKKNVCVKAPALIWILVHVTMLVKPTTVITPEVIYISACKVTEVPSFSCGLNNLFTQWLILVELVPVYQLWREEKETEKECLHESISLAMNTATCVNACQTLKLSNSQGHLHLLAKSQKPLVSLSLKSFTHWLILVELVTVYKLQRGKKETEKRMSARKHQPRCEYCYMCQCSSNPKTVKLSRSFTPACKITEAPSFSQFGLIHTVIDPSRTCNSIQAPEGKKRNRKKNVCMKASASLWTTCANARKTLNYPKLSKLPSSFTSLLAKSQKSLVSYSFERLIHTIINPSRTCTSTRALKPLRKTKHKTIKRQPQKKKQKTKTKRKRKKRLRNKSDDWHSSQTNRAGQWRRHWWQRRPVGRRRRAAEHQCSPSPRLLASHPIASNNNQKKNHRSFLILKPPPTLLFWFLFSPPFSYTAINSLLSASAIQQNLGKGGL